jgi:hypothetical protein
LCHLLTVFHLLTVCYLLTVSHLLTVLYEKKILFFQLGEEIKELLGLLDRQHGCQLTVSFKISN